MKVFISHARADKEWAKNLVDQLKVRGLQAWLAEDELHPGSPWEEQVKTALIESDALVAILNEGTPRPNVLFELGMALGQGKRVIPVIINERSDSSVITNLSHVHAIRSGQVEKVAQEIVEATRENVSLA